MQVAALQPARQSTHLYRLRTNVLASSSRAALTSTITRHQTAHRSLHTLVVTTFDPSVPPNCTFMSKSKMSQPPACLTRRIDSRCAKNTVGTYTMRKFRTLHGNLYLNLRCRRKTAIHLLPESSRYLRKNNIFLFHQNRTVMTCKLHS